MQDTSLCLVLVEPNDTDARWFERQLQEGGLSCGLIRFSSDTDAINGLQETPAPDVLFATWRLPSLSGREFVLAVRDTRGLEQTPIVMCFTSPDDLDVKQAYALGVKHCPEKPIASDVLRLILLGITNAAACSRKA